jgi:hypothetical protein
MSGIVMFAYVRQVAAFTGLAPPTLRESLACRCVGPHLAVRTPCLSRPPRRRNRVRQPQKLGDPAAAELFSFRQDSANHSMPIGAAVVWRFSPIHF